MNRRSKLIFKTTMLAWVALTLAVGSAAWLPPRAGAALAPETFADLAQKDSPAVVNISTEKIVKSREQFKEFFGQGGPHGPMGPSPFGPHDPFREFFDKFFGEIPKEFKQKSLGSGFIIDSAKGLIITNNHVISGAEKIRIKLIGGRELSGVVKGGDAKTDLALVEIKNPPKDLPALALGDSDAMRVGDWVLAVGNPFGLGNTVTQGIISAKGRIIGAGPYDNFLQTDAAINPGNSGGPLLNLKGEVIGINTAIVASGQGIGFAIPSNIAKTIIPQLEKTGKVIRGMLGVQVQTVTPELAKSFGLAEPKGALVAEVNAGSPAEKAGIQRGDIIIEFNGQSINDMNELPRLVASTTPGTKAKVKVLRAGKEKTFEVTVTELKEERQAKGGQEKEEEGGIGLAVQNLDQNLARRLGLKETQGVVAVQVAPASPAAEAGLRPGDLIMEINGNAVQNVKEYKKIVAGLAKGSVARFLVKRQSHTLYFTVEMPS